MDGDPDQRQINLACIHRNRAVPLPWQPASERCRRPVYTAGRSQNQSQLRKSKNGRISLQLGWINAVVQYHSTGVGVMPGQRRRSWSGITPTLGGRCRGVAVMTGCGGRPCQV